jgi:hypothetical protein
MKMELQNYLTDKDLDYLQENGFHRVTPEACGYGLRVLYDIDLKALGHLTDFLSLVQTPVLKLQRRKGIGSIMLGHMQLVELVPFIMLRNGAFSAHRMIGLTRKTEWVPCHSRSAWENARESMTSLGIEWEVRINWNFGDHGNSRNYHMMMGFS